jgi:hypothetical protein
MCRSVCSDRRSGASFWRDVLCPAELQLRTVVRPWKLDSELISQEPHVDEVGATGFVAEVRSHLRGRGATRHFDSPDRSRDWRVVVPALHAVELYLVSTAIRRRPDGMQVNRSTIRMPEGHGRWQPVPCHREPLFFEDGPDREDCVLGDDEVEVRVRACLSAHEGIHTPAAVHPCVHPGARQRLEHSENLFSSHVHSVRERRLYAQSHERIIATRRAREQAP